MKLRILLILAILLLAAACTAQPVVEVKAIIFYTPACNHCSEVIDQTITDLQSKYTETLKLTWIDVTGERGREVYQNCIKHYPISPDQILFPVVLIDDQVLVGEGLIENFLPAIQDGIDNGGLDWPQIGDFACNPER